MADVAITDLLNQARQLGLTVSLDGAEVVIKGPRKAEALVKQLFERKPEIIAALEPSEHIPKACPVCGSEISSVTSADGLNELFGCHATSGEHWHKWVERSVEATLPSEWSEIVIPEPLPIDITTRCYNGYCPAIVTFKQGRGCCPRCGVVQRIVE